MLLNFKTFKKRIVEDLNDIFCPEYKVSFSDKEMLRIENYNRYGEFLSAERLYKAYGEEIRYEIFLSRVTKELAYIAKHD